jgi:hypothetical protein
MNPPMTEERLAQIDLLIEGIARYFPLATPWIEELRAELSRARAAEKAHRDSACCRICLRSIEDLQAINHDLEERLSDLSYEIQEAREHD